MIKSIWTIVFRVVFLYRLFKPVVPKVGGGAHFGGTGLLQGGHTNQIHLNVNILYLCHSGEKIFFLFFIFFFAVRISVLK